MVIANKILPAITQLTTNLLFICHLIDNWFVTDNLNGNPLVFNYFINKLKVIKDITRNLPYNGWQTIPVSVV